MKQPFDKINLSQLYILCNIISDSKIKRLSYIKRKYLENAMWFDETLSLLNNINIVKINSEEIIISKPFEKSLNNIEEFKENILFKLLSYAGEMSNIPRKFLMNFKVDADDIMFKATDIEKLEFSSIRNILLELGFIKSNYDNSIYYIDKKYTELFINHFRTNKLSLESFKKKQNENNEVGLNAEIEIIHYEKNRLTNISLLPSDIEHVSLGNVLAGYDIKSIENHLDNNSKKVERYIEVKAVSIEDYKFYWSKNEIEIAKFYGDKYFLYLLPVISNNKFDLENLLIIKDPFKNVFLNSGEWNKEAESISFSIKTITEHEEN